jgi:amino acid transporter
VLAAVSKKALLTFKQFITISGVLGAGLYLDSGIMLSYGGGTAVLVAYALLGLLAILVMECIGEMICIWPIPNALVEFVRKFVDEDLGILVGIAYW